MTPVEILEAAQKIWDMSHTGVGYKVDNTAGEYSLMLQQAGGSTIFEGAINSFTHEDTWDEIMAGLAGDLVQSVLLVGKKGIVTIPLDALGISMDVSLGTLTKDLYKQYKYGPAYLRKGEFWDYLTNWEATPNDGVYNPIAYAKVKALRNSDGSVTYYKDNATGMYVFQEIYKTEYDHHLATIQAASDLIGRMAFDVQIENTNGVLKVTMPDGVIYAMGNDTSNTINGGAKNDVLFGSGGNDTLNGGAGNDQLYGQAGADNLNGGSDYDKYYTTSGDKVYDSDGSGAVYLGGEHLDGGEKKIIKHIGVTTTNYTKTFIYCECKTITKWSDVSTDEWEEKEEYYIDKATGTKYILSNSTLSVISSSGTITINNFSNGQLDIHLSEKETIDKKNVERDVFLQEDFCSPLILDINNGTSSTGLGNSQTYFDMDGDGFKERTAWVEQGDGLLVLDRNGNGVIDNGTELFGNFTPLVRGNSASDGFEALLQYDENRDGIIDHNDAPYNQLKVWMDDNANGITDTGELKTLQEAKVASLKLNAYYKSQRKAA
jgi:Ca2+-binding RTX toxin-like protein